MNYDNTEEWRDVPEFEGFYQVSTFGNVRSFERNGTRGGMLKQYPDRYGYSKVVLYKHDKPHYFTVHRLVALTFIPKCDVERNQVNHKNNIRNDNNVLNLEWVTNKENIYYSLRQGRQRTVLCPVVATEIKTNKVQHFSSQREAARQLKVQQANIYRVLKGEYSHTGGYSFKRDLEGGLQL